MADLYQYGVKKMSIRKIVLSVFCTSFLLDTVGYAGDFSDSGREKLNQKRVLINPENSGIWMAITTDHQGMKLLQIMDKHRNLVELSLDQRSASNFAGYLKAKYTAGTKIGPRDRTYLIELKRTLRNEIDLTITDKLRGERVRTTLDPDTTWKLSNALLDN